MRLTWTTTVGPLSVTIRLNIHKDILLYRFFFTQQQHCNSIHWQVDSEGHMDAISTKKGREGAERGLDWVSVDYAMTQAPLRWTQKNSKIPMLLNFWRFVSHDHFEKFSFNEWSLKLVPVNCQRRHSPENTPVWPRTFLSQIPGSTAHM